MNLKDKVVVITGGGQGLGRAIAIGLAEKGAKLADSGCGHGDLSPGQLGPGLWTGVRGRVPSLKFLAWAAQTAISGQESDENQARGSGAIPT